MKQQTQQGELKAIAMRVLERSERNSTRNKDATTPLKQRNNSSHIRAEKLRMVAEEIIEVSFDVGVAPEIGLGFFTALDWKQLADGSLNSTALRLAVEYAKELHEQIRAGVRVVDVSKVTQHSEQHKNERENI